MEEWNKSNKIYLNKTEFLYNENPRNDKQIEYALENRIPFVIFLGEEEIKNKQIKLKVKKHNYNL